MSILIPPFQQSMMVTEVRYQENCIHQRDKYEIPHNDQRNCKSKIVLLTAKQRIIIYWKIQFVQPFENNENLN